MSAFKVVIPARYGSSRLPGKPLLEIAGRPLLEYVYEAARRSAAEEVVIATDDERIASRAEAFGASVCLTDAAHPSGTDRVAEVVRTRQWGPDVIVVNLQGDEPLMPAELLDQVAGDLAAHPDASIATLCIPIRSTEEFLDPHIVKVARNRREYALYFSRAPIPWDREAAGDNGAVLPRAAMAMRHIGLYAYRAGFLLQFADSPACALEDCERLEQLRALWQGIAIRVPEAVALPGPGVDTPADLERVTELIAARSR